MHTSFARTSSRRAGLMMFDCRWVRDVSAARTVAALAPDVPLGHGVRLDVVVHRVAAVAERPRRALLCPPGRTPPTNRCRAGRDRARTSCGGRPTAPGRNSRRPLLPVALLPFAAVDEVDVVLGEGDERIGLGEIRDDRLRVLARIAHHVGHSRLLPARVDLLMAGFGRPRSPHSAIRT